MSTTDDDSHRRPAEVQLPRLIGDVRQSLLDGFESRAAVLKWLQKLSITTLGEVDTELFVRFATEFQNDSKCSEGTKLACFLNPDQRTRDISDHVAESFREQWAAEIISPASSAAMRRLRNDAVEYAGADSDSGGQSINDDVTFQRPALDELHTHQQQSLTRLLDDGLDDRADILDWGDGLLLATRGERIWDAEHPGEYVRRLYNDASADLIMCSTEPHWIRFRQFWICRKLLPSFNRGVRDLYGKSTEEAGESNSSSEAFKQT